MLYGRVSNYGGAKDMIKVATKDAEEEVNKFGSALAYSCHSSQTKAEYPRNMGDLSTVCNFAASNATNKSKKRLNDRMT